MTGRVPCGNDDCNEDAVVRLSWPGRRFKDTTGCRDCLYITLDNVIYGEPDADYPVLISPLGQGAS